jgi:two-component system alkaline phosphatase synthesis response regulator PhoP
MGTLTFHIVSTDRTISGRWQKAFQKEGWPVTNADCCPAGEEIHNNRSEFDLVEVGVPACQNQEALKSIIQTRRPVSTIVFGDPQKTSNRQIAAFLEAGADDFVYKNLDERILVAKLKAHMRRIMPEIAEIAAKLASSCGDIEIDRNRRAVKIAARTGKNTELTNLTEKEFDILSMLVRHEKVVLTRERILEKLWGNGGDGVYSECIDKHIESLRRKLGTYGKRIKTVYGAGYMFTGSDVP